MSDSVKFCWRDNVMEKKISFSKEKVSASYKTLYIHNDMAERINEIAKENNTSFNHVVISMLDYCINSNFPS